MQTQDATLEKVQMAGMGSAAPTPIPIPIPIPRPNSQPQKRKAEEISEIQSPFTLTTALPINGDDTTSATRPPTSQITEEGDKTLVNPPTPIHRPEKRPKLSFTKHASHWGSGEHVYVQLGDVRFKLPRGRLVKHSAYFKQALEPDGEGDGGSNGVIFLDDTEVKLVDFEILLDALEDFMDYVDTPAPFATIASILRAATTLSFDKYKIWGRRHLIQMWPTSHYSITVKHIPHAIESLALAREYNIPSIRTGVLYELFRSPKFGQQPGGPQLPIAELNILSAAREELATIWLDTIATPFPDIDKRLARTHGCAGRRVARIETARAKLMNESGVYRKFMWDPICGLDALSDLDWAEEGFCEECGEVRDIKAMWRAKRWAVGRELEKMFLSE